MRTRPEGKNFAPCAMSSHVHRAQACAEPPRTNEAIIRSFPGRVLTVTVLAAHKRPLSFDSCLPADIREAAAKRARPLYEESTNADARAHQHPETGQAPVHQRPDACAGREPAASGNLPLAFQLPEPKSRRLEVGPRLTPTPVMAVN